MGKEQDTVLKIKNVSVVFDGFQALTDVNVKVKRNSIHFFIGPNGAGKTTLLDIICAKTKPTEGNVSFYPADGEKVRLTGMKEYKIVKEGVVRKFQVPSVFVNLTVEENMELSLKGNKGVWQSVFHRTSEEEKALIDETLKKVGLEKRIVVEHDMDFVKQIADCVTVLHEGKVLMEGDIHQVLADETVQAVYLGRGGERNA